MFARAGNHLKIPPVPNKSNFWYNDDDNDDDDDDDDEDDDYFDDNYDRNK